jgi:hypothetical protein
VERPDRSQRRHPLARPRLAQRAQAGTQGRFRQVFDQPEIPGLEGGGAGQPDAGSVRHTRDGGDGLPDIDKDFLARIYGAIGEDTQNDGWLYEFSWQEDWRFTDFGTDLAPYKLRFEATTHESSSDENKYRKVQELVTLANQTPEDRFVEVLGSRFDLPGFIRFVAAQAFLGDTDGFLGAFGINNFYLYRLENQDKHVLISWDTDNTFWGPTFPVRPDDTNVLMQKLMRIPEYNAMWYAELARAAQLAEADNWLDAEIIRNVQLIDSAIKEDVYKPYSNNSYEAESGEMLSFARERLAYVKCALAQGDHACGG